MRSASPLVRRRALALNTDMQQVFVNLIWSPFAEVRDGTFGSGWLDVGLEYVFTRRDLFGGTAAAGSAGRASGSPTASWQQRSDGSDDA